MGGWVGRVGVGVGVGVIVGQRDAKMSSKYPGMKREKCGAYSRRYRQEDGERT